MDEAEQKITRLPPQNIEAEQALLGAILTNPNAFEKVSDFLKDYHFVSPVHGEIYHAIETLHAHGRSADPVVLKGYLADSPALKEAGGIRYLMDLTAAATSIINAEDYGRLIFDRYLRRQLIGLGTDIVNDAYVIDLAGDAETQMGRAEQKLYDLGTEGQAEGGLDPLSKALTQVVNEVAEATKNPDGLSGISTGFRDLDKKMGGLHNSDLIILAGRPGMGKTAFATCLAFNAARKFMEENKAGKPPKGAAFFSLEMSASQLAGRILSMETQISSDDMRNGRITSDAFRRCVDFAAELEKVPLYVDDTPGLTVAAIHKRCRRLKRDPLKGLGLVVIDYLQLIDMTKTNFKDSMVQALTETTRQLKIMAKDLDVPVVVLSQLNRSVEQREDKRPLMSDLRDSGSIEQDADIVMFVFREWYYLQNEKPIMRQNEKEEKFAERVQQYEKDLIDLENKAELILSKHRHGSTGRIFLSFESRFTRFGDWIEDAAPNG